MGSKNEFVLVEKLYGSFDELNALFKAVLNDHRFAQLKTRITKNQDELKKLIGEISRIEDGGQDDEPFQEKFTKKQKLE